MFRLLFFVGIGLVLGGAVVQVVGPPGAAAWAIPLGATLTVMCGVLVSIGRTLRGVPLSSPKPAEVEAARDAGRMGLARIEALRQTGTQLNDQPVCDLDVVVRLQGGDAFRTTCRRILEVTELARYQPGSVHVVAQLAADRPALAFTGDDPTASVWQTTVIPQSGGDVRTWTEDGEGAGGRRPLIGIGRRGRPLRLVLFAVAAALAATAVVYPYRVGLAQTVDALGEGHWHADVRDPQVLSDAVDQLREALGHDVVSEVHVSDDLISVEAPIEPGKLASDSWLYRRGKVDHRGPSVIQPQSVDEQFSLDEVAWGRVRSLVDRAVAEADLAGPVTASITVDRGTIDDIDSKRFGDSAGPVEITVSVQGDYGSAFFDADADGTRMRRVG